jgi:hypothetical protein
VRGVRPFVRERRALVARWEADRHVSQEGAEAQGGADAARQELEQLREWMAVIKQEAAAEVDRKWGSPFRTQEVFDLKVQARLSGNDEYPVAAGSGSGDRGPTCSPVGCCLGGRLGEVDHTSPFLDWTRLGFERPECS